MKNFFSVAGAGFEPDVPFLAEAYETSEFDLYSNPQLLNFNITIIIFPMMIWT